MTIRDLSILDYVEQSQRVVSCVLRSQVGNSDISHLFVKRLSNLNTCSMILSILESKFEIPEVLHLEWTGTDLYVPLGSECL